MQTKADLFPADLARLAEMARALGHPARLAILQTLAARQACVCGEIVEALPLAQATVSQHLKVLKAAGLVQGEVDGPRSCYCLDREALARFQDAFATFFGDAIHVAPEEACAPDASCC